MPLDRRLLLSRIGSGFGAALLLPSFRADAGRVLLAAAKAAEGKKPAELAGDEAYWSEIARAFDADLMQRASYANQARVHNGYHYPRSLLTALGCLFIIPIPWVMRWIIRWQASQIVLVERGTLANA